MSASFPVVRTTASKPRPPESELGFGRFFTDHMVMIEWARDRGWHDGKIVPYGPVSLDPAAGVFHYGQAMFEGMKAFRGGDGKVRLFRADMHTKRMHDGAARLCMPAIDPELLFRGIQELVALDRDWVPSGDRTALYIRPTLIASEPFLGVRPADRYTLFVIASPVGPYYSETKGVRIWVEDHFTRAAPGGLGNVKAGANYVASLLAAKEAKDRGYAQVLWLDATEHRFIDEVGTMNIFFRIGEELVTPPLDGTILGGVTRDSILWLARSWGVRVSERRIGLDELRSAHQKGKLEEAFGSGTAAVITPVAEFGTRTEKIAPRQEFGELATKLLKTISGIQHGALPDPDRWTTEI
jgi:branched-chain amino acid aminotransferase